MRKDTALIITSRAPRRSFPLAVVAALSLTALAALPPARGQAAEPVVGEVAANGASVAPAPVPPPPPYSLPWGLRPVAPGNVVRSDNTVAFYDGAPGSNTSGSTVVSTLLAGYKVTPNLAPLVRLAFVQNSEPGRALGSGQALVNLPVGMGGDKARTMDETAAAAFRGIAARSAMDNAMFAVNYLVGIAGFDAAYVAHKATVQVEASLLQLFRARNEMLEKDKARTNLTAGIHVGYFVLPMLSLGGELRHQRWLSTPAAVKLNEKLSDTTTFAVGPRCHFKISPTMWIRPGISYARAFDSPLSDAKYSVLQIDVPVAF